MIRELKTVDEVVAELGGSGAIKAITGSKHTSAVSNWKKLGRFPAKTHKVLQDALCAKGLTAPDSLWGLVHG